MRKILIVCLVMVLSSAAIAQTDTYGGSTWYGDPASEVGLDFTYFWPSQQFSGIYDQMYGFETFYRNWFSKPWGYAVTLSFMDAEVREDNTHIVDPSIAVFKDSARMIPLGISGLYNIYEGEEWAFNLEAGLRYVFIDSSVEMVDVATGTATKVDMDNALVGLFRVDADYKIAEQWTLFASGGVQVDLAVGDLTARGEELSGNNLKGYSLSLGASYLF